MSKFCSSCKEELPEECFWRNRSQKDGLTDKCIQCKKAYMKVYRAGAGKDYSWFAHNIKHLYGITAEDYENLCAEQNSVCAICKQPERQLYKNRLKRLCVDHDHSSGRVRGLLCCDCNTSIGKLKHDPEILNRAIEYLNNAKASEQ